MNTNKRAIQRKTRTRAKIVGSAKKPRLSIFRSNKSVSAQLIDDVSHKTIMTLTQKGLKIEEKAGKTEISRALGVEFAKKAKERKITAIIFDRGPYSYHGRVKAFAEGLREGGIKF